MTEITTQLLLENGSVDAEAMLREAPPFAAPASPPNMNTHIHLPPNFSAFASPAHPLDLAAEQDVVLLGLSNYYDFTVYESFGKDALGRGILPLYGIEIMARDEELAAGKIRVNDPGNPGKIYVCGKGAGRFNAPAADGAAVLNRIRLGDDSRMTQMISQLNQLIRGAGVDVAIDEAAIKDALASKASVPVKAVHLQERHLAGAFEQAVRSLPEAEQAPAFAKLLGVAAAELPSDSSGLQNLIRSKLLKAGKPAFVPENYVTVAEACTLILALGAIPCYPTLADGVDPICEFEETPEQLITQLQKLRFHCAEFIPIRNKPEILQKYVPAMRAAGLVISAGTEHNTPALIPLKPACAGNAPIPPEVEAIFYEGACLELAHQFMTFHGATGYVDSNGDLNPAFADHEERIGKFAGLGHAILTSLTTSSSSAAG